MISTKILHRHSAGKAMHYYAEQKDDYFSRDGGAAQWQGQAAQALGLTGDIDPRQFADAMRGDFGPGVQLPYSVRLDSQARAALDITFSAPKSVSIQALAGKDHVVLAAHDQAVTRALEFLESELMLARRKEGGVTTVERTGNAAIAKWRHETSRPSQDALADPQLHTHALVLNITQRADGSWTAMSNEEIFRSQRLLDAVYQSELATALEKAGYALRHEGNHAELAHISRAQIEAFSKRSQTIEEELAKIGESRMTASPGLKQAITLSTRQVKAKEVTRAMLQQDWERQATALGLDFGAAKQHEAALARGRDDARHDVQPAGQEDQAPDQDLGQDHGQAHEWADGLDHAPSLSADGDADDGAGAGTAQGRANARAPQSAGRERQVSPAHEAQNSASSSPAADKVRARVAHETVRWSIKHLTERESVMMEKQLLEVALNHSRGTGVTVRDLRAAISDAVQRGHLIQGVPLYRSVQGLAGRTMTRAGWVQFLVAKGLEPEQARQRVRQAIKRGSLLAEGQRYTTQVAREREKRILQIEREGRGAVAPILSAEAAEAALAGRGLKPGQLAAGELILGTADRVVGVQGLAGTGKSHMLDQVKRIAEASGYTVRAVASYGMQIRALRELGVEAKTIASVLEARNQDRFKLDDKTVLVVDEAGVVPTRLLEKLLKRAEEAGARVVLLGDTAQTKAIEAGRPFHQLQDAGMATARMADIIRQENADLRHAVELAAEGRAAQALDVLDTKRQAVHQVADNAERYEQIARRYASLSAEDRQETLILTGTNDSRNALNEATHQALGLAGRGFEFNLLTRRDTTQAQRRQAKYYELGDIIQPERNYVTGTLVQEEMYRIVGRDVEKNRLEVERLATGERSTFNPSRTTKLSVYQLVRAELSAGEKVRVTRNDAGRDLVNGGRFDVLAVTPNSVILGNGQRRVELDASTLPLHLDRAYATTGHSAQGLTSDRAIINAESFSRTTKADVFYVNISRARHETIIYTDNAKKLPGAASRQEDKTAALDIGLAIPADRQRAQAERTPSTPSLER